MTSRLVKRHQAVHYDLLAHRITVTPLPQMDELDQPKKRISASLTLAFESVADIAISSGDNVVIGRCLSCSIEPEGSRQNCKMVLDNFGTEVSVSFTFSELSQ